MDDLHLERREEPDLESLRTLYEDDPLGLLLVDITLAYNRFWDNEIHNDAFNHRLSYSDLQSVNDALKRLRDHLRRD